jgi:hypothetical protein
MFFVRLWALDSNIATETTLDPAVTGTVVTKPDKPCPVSSILTRLSTCQMTPRNLKYELVGRLCWDGMAGNNLRGAKVGS